MLKYVNYSVVFQEIPGETTLAINISNCPVKCPGCHSKYLWENIGLRLDEEFIDSMMRLYGHEITCMAFMGGDADPDRILEIVGYIKKKYPAIKTAWYSGMTKIRIKNLDYIKVGPYIKEKGGLRNPNTNQRLYKITNGIISDITKMFWVKKRK